MSTALRWIRWRYSLRTLLITTTLVAVVLEMILWVARASFSQAELMLEVALRLIAAYCWLMGGVSLLICTMNGTPPLLVAGFVHVGVAVVATVVVIRIGWGEER